MSSRMISEKPASFKSSGESNTLVEVRLNSVSSRFGSDQNVLPLAGLSEI